MTSQQNKLQLMLQVDMDIHMAQVDILTNYVRKKPRGVICGAFSLLGGNKVLRSVRNIWRDLFAKNY
jgi:hypothetical protein